MLRKELEVRPGVAALASRAYIRPVPSPLYTRDILRLATSISHLGLLDPADARSERASAVCGSRVIVTVRVDREGRVIELGHEVRACALGQASAAIMGAAAVGRNADELAAARDRLSEFLKGNRDDPGDWPAIATLVVARDYPARHASIMLPFEAVAEAAAQAAQSRAASSLLSER